MAIWGAATRRFVQAMEQVQRGIKLAQHQSVAKTAVSATAQCLIGYCCCIDWWITSSMYVTCSKHPVCINIAASLNGDDQNQLFVLLYDRSLVCMVALPWPSDLSCF